jgi:hypothetical protein
MHQRCEKRSQFPNWYVIPNQRHLASLSVVLLERWGYKSGDIVLLTDDARDRRQLPTKKNMIDAMRWLVHGAKCHDALFFHCKFDQTHSINLDISSSHTDSGHGGQVKDLDGDEIDGYDEGKRPKISLYTIFLNE